MSNEAAPLEQEPVGAHVVRAQLLQRGRRFAIPVPDGLMAVILASAATLDFIPPEMLGLVPATLLQYREELAFGLIVEGGFLMMQGTLIDIASRLRKRPPIWLIAVIVAGVALFSSEALGVLKMAWGRGMVVFIPLLISLAERGAVLWHLPNRSRIQKIAARALVANRITTALALFALLTLVMMIGVIFPNLYEWSNLGAWPTLAAGAIYFAVAAFDDWRVRGRRFAEKPRVLFGFDPIHINYLDPL